MVACRPAVRVVAAVSRREVEADPLEPRLRRERLPDESVGEPRLDLGLVGVRDDRGELVGDDEVHAGNEVLVGLALGGNGDDLRARRDGVRRLHVEGLLDVPARVRRRGCAGRLVGGKLRGRERIVRIVLGRVGLHVRQERGRQVRVDDRDLLPGAVVALADARIEAVALPDLRGVYPHGA